MKINNLRILITGGSGFIGSHLAEALIKIGNKVIAYDNLDDYYFGKEENIKHNLNKQNFNFLKADILNYETLSKYMRGIDVVYHLAAQPGVRFSMNNPDKTLAINVLGTANVLKAARKAFVKRVVFASTSSVYGHPKYIPIDEKHPTEPISIYGASKLAAETICRVFNDQLNLGVVILRYHTVYGPRQRPDMAIHKWTRQIFEGKPITIYGDGSQTRDFTYIDNVVNANIKAAETTDIEGKTFNIGGGSRVTINDVVKKLIRISEVENIQIKYEPSKLGDVKDTHADITKARSLLGFEPNVTLEDGLIKFVKWYNRCFLN